MTLNASGPISLAGTTAGQSIEIENGGNGTTQISLNDTAVRTLAGGTATATGSVITMPTNFYGKSNQYTYSVSTNKTNFCMRAGAISAGWNGTSKLVVNISSIISSNSTSTPAMTITGAFPGGVAVNNSGTIVGMGGGGGGGAGGSFTNQPGGGGGGGGTALKVLSPVTVNNTGTIAGGGGGGGGGGSSWYGEFTGGGGGGGRSSFAANSSGANPGTYASAGAGGCGASGNKNYNCYCYPSNGGGGGTGGNWGASGGPGGTGSNPCGSNGGGGGGGGNATCGAGTYITWTGTGTRYGSIG